MPLATYSTTHSSTIPKLQLDYLNKVYKRQAVRYDRFAKDPEQPRRHSIVSISNLESFPSVRGLLAPQVPPEVAGPPSAISETVPPPATAIIEALSAARPKQAADTAHKRQISEAIPQNERPIARQARPEPAERDTWEDRQGDAEGGAAAGTLRRVAVRISLNSAVEGSNW
jgi:hypothetical protein